jgi:hypothetical protein
VSTLNGLLAVSDKVDQIISSSFSLHHIFWHSKEIDICGMLLRNMSDSNLQCIGLMYCVFHMSQGF